MAVSKSKRKANDEYDAKTYSQVNIRLRVDDDADIIESIREARDHEIPYREWLRELFDNQK